MSPRAGLGGARRVVVKVGSQLLADDDQMFARVAAQLAHLRGEGREVVLVTSGAIALGYPMLGLARRPRTLDLLQAAAACGQSQLMARWGAALGREGQAVAQVLLTHGDLTSRTRYLNARSALLALLRAGIVPVVNENDCVSVEEIKLGDNDLLAAEVCGLVSAELVVLLTGVDGFLSADPAADPAARRIPHIEVIDEALWRSVGRPSPLGTGGMGTKLRAAERARGHGAATVIAPGKQPDVLAAILRGADIGTLISSPVGASLRARKRWIGQTLTARGRLFVDEGAERALRSHGSLLLAGVSAVEGAFRVGDCVEIARQDGGDVFARGLAAMGADEARKVAGLRMDEAAHALATPLPDALVHRDDFVLIDAVLPPRED